MKKMDEMQMSINVKAIKWSWLFTVIALFIWGMYTFIKTRIISPAIYIVIFQNIIYYFITQITKWRMGDEDGRKSILWYAIALPIGLLLFGVLLYFFPK
jgi:hypothetical protein